MYILKTNITDIMNPEILFVSKHSKHVCKISDILFLKGGEKDPHKFYSIALKWSPFLSIAHLLVDEPRSRAEFLASGFGIAYSLGSCPIFYFIFSPER